MKVNHWFRLAHCCNVGVGIQYLLGNGWGRWPRRRRPCSEPIVVIIVVVVVLLRQGLIIGFGKLGFAEEIIRFEESSGSRTSSGAEPVRRRRIAARSSGSGSWDGLRRIGTASKVLPAFRRSSSSGPGVPCPSRRFSRLPWLLRRRPALLLRRR